MRRRDVWRGDLRTRRRTSHVLWWWWHHCWVHARIHLRIEAGIHRLLKLLLHCVLIKASLSCSNSSGSGSCMLLVASSGVWVVVDARVSRQLVRPAEAFGAARKLARVWLFTRVRANVSCLVLETVKGLVAQGTLVWTWQIRSVVILRLHIVRHGGQARGGSCCHQLRLITKGRRV